MRDSLRMCCVLLILCCVAIVVHSKDERVAFIFSGGARSITIPLVHRTIHSNLLQSFCPRPTCTYDVFVRVSYDDNHHVGIDSTGKFVRSSHQFRQAVDEILSHHLRPPLSSGGGEMIISRYNIGSAEENALLDESAKKSLLHRVYRTLDSRRYSMFYTRWAAHEMMLQHERQRGLKYDWVVHARLDMAWMEPIKPHFAWTHSKLYAADCWFADIPDTFAIMSRGISERYYNLDAYFKPQVACLGGPNFDPYSISTANLTVRGFSEEEIKVIQENYCHVQFPDGHTGGIPGTNLTWSLSGFSEYILKRKMESLGVSLEHDNVVYTHFNGFLVRNRPFETVCFYLHPEFIIGYVMHKQAGNTAHFVGCYYMSEDLRLYQNTSSASCALNADNAVWSPAEVATTDSCLLTAQHTELNFMPFRFRMKNKCWTTSPHEHHNISTSQACINLIRRERQMETYAFEQLFYFYPLITRPQQLRQVTLPPDVIGRCLTVWPTSAEHKFRLDMRTCVTGSWFQLFSFQTHHNDRIANIRANSASTSKQKPLTPMTATWRNEATGLVYCLFANQASGELLLKRCFDPSAASPSSSEYVGLTRNFMVERTVSITPYREGITVGEFPN